MRYEDQLFVDAHLGDWRAAADLPARLAECARFVDARRLAVEPSATNHPADGAML
jgi:hypothetical protein